MVALWLGHGMPFGVDLGLIVVHGVHRRETGYAADIGADAVHRFAGQKRADIVQHQASDQTLQARLGAGRDRHADQPPIEVPIQSASVTPIADKRSARSPI